MNTQVVLITGGLTGIGRATALAFARRVLRLLFPVGVMAELRKLGAEAEFAASKHAVEGLTKSAALEAAASGVRVNMVAPGPIETAMLNRFTGTSERKEGLAATVPLKRVG